VRRWNVALRGEGQNRVAVPFVVPENVSAPDVVAALAEADVRALVIAPEFQEVVGQGLDDLETMACRIGRVNLVEVRNGRLVGGWIEDEADLAVRLGTSTVPA
jgi:shikimate 5-dehydrogenase